MTTQLQQAKEGLEKLAKYASTRADEMKAAGMREVAREALAALATVSSDAPVAYEEHTGCELSYAAACYAVGYPDPRYWPRDWYFKEGDVRRKLIKAGALIVAEIERLDRAAAPKEP